MSGSFGSGSCTRNYCVCQIEDLPKALRAVAEAILKQERRKSAVET